MIICLFSFLEFIYSHKVWTPTKETAEKQHVCRTDSGGWTADKLCLHALYRQNKLKMLCHAELLKFDESLIC